MEKVICAHCGNNPVPHLFYWYNESMNIWLTPLRQKLLYNNFFRFFKRKFWDQKFLGWLLGLGEKTGIVSRQENLSLCKVRRAQVLWEEAQKRGVHMSELLFLGRPFDSYAAEFEGEKMIFSGLPRPKGYINNWLDLMDDKWQLKQIMQKNNLPVPLGGSCSSFRQALKIFDGISKPIIVKPRSGSRGRHSTTFIYNSQDLLKAFKIAKKICYWVMVEEQLTGPVYRATVINFELAGVLRGDAPQVTGDGEHTIAQLVSIKNSAPHSGVKNIVADDVMELFLSRQNLKFSSIPKINQLVNLSEKIGVNYGGSSSEDFEICHEDNKELFVRAAKILGDPLVGFDFIIPDISKSFKEQKCGFIEVNSLPFINLHHDPLIGKAQNVAARVWDMVGF